MHFEFSSHVTIEESVDSLLSVTLAGCAVECDITVECESDDEYIRLNGVHVDHVEFAPPDSLEAIRARLFMGPELMDAIRKDAEEKVERDWSDYEAQAEEALMSKIESIQDEYDDGSW